MTEPEVRHYLHDCGPVRLHVAEAGKGPAVLLLHGFPELWYGFRHLLKQLAAAGYRVLAPDLRGYGASDKPASIGAYRVAELLGDLRALIRDRCGGRAHVVAHDWGGTLAYCLASESPDFVDRLTILNAAHPERLGELWLSSAQLLRSWYIFAFQLPLLPELLLRQHFVIEHIFRGSAARPDAFSRDDLLAYHAALRVPRAATSAVNYYRASLRWPVEAPQLISARTLVIWGDHDPALDPKLLLGLERYVPNLSIRHVANAGHFVHHEQPDLVLRLVREHLAV